MKKPTIFISHSSLDKTKVKVIKDKLIEYTGGTIDVFVSSDGESISFGKNWLSTIQQGLEDSAIMFLFITPNSLDNLWVSFEAGFGYSKNIKVIPLCFGVSVSDLKYPLGMLQGYDLLSSDNLNNIISIINKEFGCSHKLSFNKSDYDSLFGEHGNDDALDRHFASIISQFSWSKSYQQKDIEGLAGKSLDFYNKIKCGLLSETERFLKNKKMHFTITGKGTDHIRVNFAGVLLRFPSAYEVHNSNSYYHAFFELTVSPYNLHKSIDLLLEYYKEVLNCEEITFTIRVKLPYNFKKESQDISALIFETENFIPENETENTYKWRSGILRIHGEYDHYLQIVITAITITSEVSILNTKDIYSMLGALYSLDILFIDENLLPDQLHKIHKKKKDLDDMNKAIKDWEKRTVRELEILGRGRR